MITTDELTSILQNAAAADPSERRAAAEALAGSDERGIYPLIRLLRDENPGVQDAAMRSLVSIGGEVTAYMALPLLREGPFLRNTARLILKQIGQLSVPLLRPLLADKDDDIRTFAVDLIADIGWCDYPDEIVRLMEADPNQNVRACAARAIGHLGGRESIPALIAALKDNEWVCFSVLESLAQLREESSADAVLALLASPSETLRYAAVETLGKIGAPRSTEPLIARLPKASAFEKTAIIKSLVLIGIKPEMEEVADQLIEMFSSGDWDDRLIALTGLADLKCARAIPMILDGAGSLDPSDPASEDRLYAVKQALEKFGCVPELLSVISDPAIKFRAKVLAIEVIAGLRCADAIPSLVGLLGGDLREVRRAAVVALGQIPGDKSLEVLRRCVDDRDGHVRNAALSALGSIGDQSSFDHLFQHLAVENYRDVLEETVRTLLRLDAGRLCADMGKLSPTVREIVARYAPSLDVLLVLTGDSEQSVHLAALSGLTRFSDQRAGTRLTEALADPDPAVRKTAVISLGALRTSIDGIKNALRDPDMWVRLYAVKVLGDFQDPALGKDLIPLLYDKEAPVVLSAIDALVGLGNEEAVRLASLQNHGDKAVRERAGQVMERAG